MNIQLEKGILREVCNVLASLEGLPCRVSEAREAIGVCESCLWVSLTGKLDEVRRYIDGSRRCRVHFNLNYSYRDISSTSAEEAGRLVYGIGCAAVSGGGFEFDGAAETRRDGGSISVCTLPMIYDKVFQLTPGKADYAYFIMNGDGTESILGFGLTELNFISEAVTEARQYYDSELETAAVCGKKGSLEIVFDRTETPVRRDLLAMRFGGTVKLHEVGRSGANRVLTLIPIEYRADGELTRVTLNITEVKGNV